jgi:hypothetical protein
MTAPARIHRALKIDRPLMHGDDVHALQLASNDIDKDKGGFWHVKADSYYGAETNRAIALSAFAIGLGDEELDEIHRGHCHQDVQGWIRHPETRNDRQKERAEERKLELQRRIAQHNKPPEPEPDGDGLATFDGRTVAAWIKPWLDKSRAAGWTGTVTSGYRTPEYSEYLCYQICGAASCPGRCAGRTSNHAGKVYPAGAVDVSDYVRFGQIQYRIGSPLRNALPTTDPIHYSYSGR